MGSLSVLVFGESKVGKSTFSVTGPAPRLLIDVEAASRFLPIRRVAWDPTSPPPKPDGSWDTAVVQLRRWDDWPTIWRWLDSGKHPFRSIVIDSVTEMQQRLIEKTASRGQLTQQAWGTVLRDMSGAVRDLRDLTEHPRRPVEAVVMTAMAKEVNGVTRPWVQGGFATVLPYLMDVTGYLTVGDDGVTRKMLTQRTDFIEAGHRTGRDTLPRVLRNPSISDMIVRIFHEAVEEEDLEDAPSDGTTADASV
jgi:hypothetical protein